MRGRKPKINWQKSKGQYTTTIDGQFYRLGEDFEEADKLLRFLLRKHDLDEPSDGNPTFGEVVDSWLLFVEENHDKERFRLCFDRLQEFVQFIGCSLRVNDLRPSHVDRWLEKKAAVKSEGTRTNYKAIILAALNWAADKRRGDLIRPIRCVASSLSRKATAEGKAPSGRKVSSTWC